MRRTHRRLEGHLDAEHLDSIAVRRARRLPSGTVAHLESCQSCRVELEALRRLHRVLASLEPLSPGIGFTDRVLTRVRLPLPMRFRVLDAIRAHRLAVAATLGGAAVAIAGGLLLGASYPELTPAALATFLLDRSLALLWSGVLLAGRIAYDAGLVTGVEGLLGQLSMGGALLLLATMSLVGLGTTRIMARLLNAPAPALRQIGR